MPLPHIGGVYRHSHRFVSMLTVYLAAKSRICLSSTHFLSYILTKYRGVFSLWPISDKDSGL